MLAVERPLSEHFKALAELATERAKRDPFEASLVPEVTAKWHVLITDPNREATAAAHLIGRGFGIYLPEFDEVVIIRGRKRVRHVRMFPGYLFVFVWDIERQLRRINSCAGVSRLLLNGDRPAIITDEQINEIQTKEFQRLVNDTPLAAPEKKRRKRLKRWELELEKHAHQQMVDGTFRVSTKSYFAEVEKADADGRNHMLHKALGLMP